MKRKIALITLLLVMVSCDDVRVPKWESYSQESGNHRLVTLTFNGISHGYVCEIAVHGGGLCHYPECKFCKNNNQL